LTEEQTTIEKAALVVPTTFKALVEALIFAAKEPLSINQVRSIYQGENIRDEISRHVEPDTVRQIIADLNKEYTRQDRPYRIVQIAGGYQFATLSDYSEWLGKLYREQGRRKLSQSGVETLAIIAYKQPVTKAEIEKIRGVNCDYVLKNLLEKELLTITGRAESVGRPLLYGTTREFLQHFGLNDITDLPRPREIEEILGESQFETERRMLEAQAGADQARKEQEEFKSRLPHIPKKKSELEEKDVEIVPHRKVMEIKITPVENRIVLEQAGQGTIEFTPENTTPQEQVATENQLQEKIQNEEKPLEPIIQIAGKQTIEVETVIAENISKSITLAGVEIPNGEVLSITGSLIHEKGQNATETEKPQSPKRWKVWREKIQGFIKKLFA
jgi:segregation and condensation protein B